MPIRRGMLQVDPDAATFDILNRICSPGDRAPEQERQFGEIEGLISPRSTSAINPLTSATLAAPSGPASTPGLVKPAAVDRRHRTLTALAADALS